MRIAAASMFLMLGYLLPAHAQVYEVQMEIREVKAPADKPAQHFTMRVDESRAGVFQAGNRVPRGEMQFPDPYIDEGVKIECAVHASGDSVSLSGSAELLKMAGFVSVGGRSEPILQQVKLAFRKTVPLGAPTEIAADPHYQVQATITPVK